MSNVDCTCGDGAYGWQCSKCYPSRTVRGMYQQEQQIAKAEEAGLIITAADLYPVYCPVCGHALMWVHDELTCFNCCAEVE